MRLDRVVEPCPSQLYAYPSNCAFLEAFRPCFSKRQWKYFVTVLLSLIECEERKTMTGLLRVVAEDVSLSGLSRFLSKWL